MTAQYILDGTTPVLEPDLLTWARWFETANRHVLALATERLGHHGGQSRQRDADHGNDGGEGGVQHY